MKDIADLHRKAREVKRQLDEHIVITGAGTGIGRAIALRMANEGAKLSLLARRVDRLEEVAEEIRADGGEAQAIYCDIRSKEVVSSSFSKAIQTFGPLRALVANSGIGGPNIVGEEDRFAELVQTNLVGTYQCLRAAQQHLIEDDNTRSLIMISSCLARFGVPGYTGYCASKAGLLGLTRALALEVAVDRIQVNSICPGWVDTQMARDGIQGMATAMGISVEEAHAEAMKAVPLGRMSKPEDVAGMVAWLLSKDGAGVTGQGLDINGGSWM